MPAKKKIENTSEVTTKTVTKRKYTKKNTETETPTTKLDATEATVITDNIETSPSTDITIPIKDEINELTDNNAVEIAEVNADEPDKAIELLSSDKEPTSDALSDNDSEDKKKKKGNRGIAEGKLFRHLVRIQDDFYDRVMKDNIQVTVHLSKIKATGVIKYYNNFHILLESNGQEQFIYKQSISFISAQKTFKKNFVKRDKVFFNNKGQGSNQANEATLQTTNTEFNDREKRFSQTQAATNTVENRQRPYLPASNPQTIKPNTDRSTFSSNKPVLEKPQSQDLEQRSSTQQANSTPNTYSSNSNNEPSQISNNEPNKTVKVFRISSSPSTKPKK